LQKRSWESRGDSIIPKITILLSLLTIAVYFLLSGGEPYIPVGKLSWLGFSVSNPIGAITYPFIHISIVHLLGNVLAFFLAGIIVENAIKGKDLLELYLLCGVLSAALYIFFFQNVVLIGASGAVAGIIFAGFLLDMKKMVLFSVLAVILTSGLIEPLDKTFYLTRVTTLGENEETLGESLSGFISRLKDIEEKKENLSTGAQDIQKKLNETLEEIVNAESLLSKGNISEQEYGVIYANLSSRNQSLSKNLSSFQEALQNVSQSEISVRGEINKTNTSLGVVSQTKVTIEEGKEMAQVTGVSHILHLIASLVSFGYLRIRKKDLVDKALGGYASAVWKYRDSIYSPRK
jgi:membrane associated rhomboid family serine protease